MKRIIIAGLAAGATLWALPALAQTAHFDVSQATQAYLATSDGPARAPDGFAQIAMKLSTYRKLDPTPLEEAIFFDHPSGRTRVETAMRWKADHIGEPGVE